MNIGSISDYRYLMAYLRTRGTFKKVILSRIFNESYQSCIYVGIQSSSTSIHVSADIFRVVEYLTASKLNLTRVPDIPQRIIANVRTSMKRILLYHTVQYQNKLKKKIPFTGFKIMDLADILKFLISQTRQSTNN